MKNFDLISIFVLLSLLITAFINQSFSLYVPQKLESNQGIIGVLNYPQISYTNGNTSIKEVVDKFKDEKNLQGGNMSANILSSNVTSDPIHFSTDKNEYVTIRASEHDKQSDSFYFPDFDFNKLKVRPSKKNESVSSIFLSRNLIDEFLAIVNNDTNTASKNISSINNMTTANPALTKRTIVDDGFNDIEGNGDLAWRNAFSDIKDTTKKQKRAVKEVIDEDLSISKKNETKLEKTHKAARDASDNKSTEDSSEFLMNNEVLNNKVIHIININNKRDVMENDNQRELLSEEDFF